MKMPLAGGTPTVLVSDLVVPGPMAGQIAITVDATSIYWTRVDYEDEGGIIEGAVMKAPLAGGTPITLARAPAGWGIAVDATSVYWTGGDAVMKVPLAGGTPTTLASGQDHPVGIAVDTTDVSIGRPTGRFIDGGPDPDAEHNGTVMKVLLAGGTPTTIASGQKWPWAIALDATHVYWTDPVTDTVKSAPK